MPGPTRLAVRKALFAYLNLTKRNVYGPVDVDARDDGQTLALRKKCGVRVELGQELATKNNFGREGLQLPVFPLS